MFENLQQKFILIFMIIKKKDQNCFEFLKEVMFK